MAPRKKGNTRMDAAIESMMKNFGFSDRKLIRATAKQLLQVYGGEWFFIEENSYSLLLDALLDCQKDDEDAGESSSKKEKLMEIELPRRAASSGNCKESVSTNDNDDDDTCAIADLPRMRRVKSKRDVPPFPWKDIGMDCVAEQPPRPSSPSPPPAAAAGLFPSKRRPCYGWIDSEEDEEKDDDENFIYLSPAKSFEDLKPPPKRFSRWDLSPEDP